MRDGYLSLNGMNRQIRILILASIIALLTLSGIQAFLISNTYQLKKGLILNQADQTLDRLDDEPPSIDSINTIWRNAFLELIAAYHSGSISKSQFLKSARHQADSINPSFIHHYNLELAKKKLGYRVKYQQAVQHLYIFLDDQTVDTIYHDESAQNWMLFGEEFPSDSSHNIGSTTWSTDHDYAYRDTSGLVSTRTAAFQFRTTDKMYIMDKEALIFKKMSGIFIASFSFSCL